ncbi:MAG: hypothetical protein WCI20_11960 [bacterium]
MTMHIKKHHVLLILLVVAVCAIPFRTQLRRPFVGVVQMIKGKHTVSEWRNNLNTPELDYRQQVLVS